MPKSTVYEEIQKANRTNYEQMEQDVERWIKGGFHAKTRTFNEERSEEAIERYLQILERTVRRVVTENNIVV